MKNLAREAKPAREKFRGQRAQQNGRVHVAWAWVPHSGRTHFAHPPPRVMGTQKALTKTWPHTVVDAHKFTRIWASIGTLYRASTTVHKMCPPTHVNWASKHVQIVPTFVHVHPRSHARYGHPNNGWTHTFQAALDDHELLWAVRHYLGHPRNWEPTRTLGHPKPTIIGHPHIIHGCPRVIVDSHAILWTTTQLCYPSTRIYGCSYVMYGHPTCIVLRSHVLHVDSHVICMGAHETLWACITVCLGRPHETLCASTHVT